ncbi:hypothetical protein SOVF_095890 [Spinacia oleracea]|uniref:Glycine-rich protein DOT1 n=1 Tax=Spinacia oleracea TaxID=3562 RepID=A0A9R0IYW4_SPIOL|nr:glycine-rich protein DOT1-like [Spinacia oleracea]KNA15690.1 hypothetical protein SOVF_095890 [Spinacia oleracea]
MKLFWVFLLLFLQINLLLIATNSFILGLQERDNIKEIEDLSDDSRLHITVVSKKGGSGGGGGGGRGGGSGGGGRGGSGRGSSGGRGGGRGRGGVPFYGAAGAAGVAGAAAAGSRGHHHRNGSNYATPQLGLTLSAVVLGLGIYLVKL